MRANMPATTTLSRISFVTIDFAPTTTLFPSVTYVGEMPFRQCEY